MNRRLALLGLLLSGCGREERFTVPDTGGSLLLLDCGDEVFDWKGEGEHLLSKMPAGDLLKYGEGVWLGETLAHRVRRRLQRGDEGPLIAFERFDVPGGRDVTLSQDGFHLRFRAEPAGEEEWCLDFEFAWEGKPKVRNRLTQPRTSSLSFLKGIGPKRYRLLLVNISSITP